MSKALKEIIDEVASQVATLLRDEDEVKFMLLTGGFSGCVTLRQALQAAVPGVYLLPLGNSTE